MGNPGAFKRSLIFSALSYLGFETYQVISRTAVVHATAKVLGVEEVLAQADYLYESGETEKLYQLLTQYKDSEDAELLWRLARVSRDVAQLSRTSEAERKLLVYEALEYAKRALEKNEASFAAHKWYAICISDVGDYEGIKAKIANAYVIKEHFEKAIELNPKDATSIHLMGIWSCIGLFRRESLRTKDIRDRPDIYQGLRVIAGQLGPGAGEQTRLRHSLARSADRVGGGHSLRSCQPVRTIRTIGVAIGRRHPPHPARARTGTVGCRFVILLPSFLTSEFVFLM
ncbi:regulator of microtubule dynamics protein 1 isoform X3 [Pteropus vampyrus]|nr:regulator of microtubule dynamics protein 1 isoform X3 [Pteropus vampyrus]XP_023376614.1 regulator of microtubule dynamics protein 1 isoform X3 [Pteropus vampyrus]XP_023376615.1 regulator of microtubule dynamics protein 1 isoform X3 [Pteropus vampyrus]